LKLYLHSLDAIEVLNSIPSNMNIQSFQPNDSVATSSHNIDIQYELLDNNSNNQILSTSVESKLNGSIFIILNYKHDFII